MKAREVTREMGSELELPKTYGFVSRGKWENNGMVWPYSHCGDKVPAAFLETECPRHDAGAEPGDQGLNDEDDWDGGQSGEIVLVDIVGELVEDCRGFGGLAGVDVASCCGT